jgi:RNA polymerase sigma factor (sigma-70 family)
MRARVGASAVDVWHPAPGEAGVSVADLTEARDHELMRRIRRADGDAFRDLFGRYAPTAMALAVRVVREAALAEEIVQEAFLSVWHNPDRYDESRGSVRAWLMATVHHRAVDAVRREQAHRRRAETVPREPTTEDVAERVVEDLVLPQERVAVRTALAALPAEQREIIELMYFGGLSQTMIADRLGLPLGTVKSRTLLGMRRLRTALGRLER